jgi:Fe-S-cluster-containing hydrogenase component 2
VTDDCIGCGTCTKDVCFVNAIHLEDKRAVINEASCRGCGRCVPVCPQEAIEVVIDNENFISESIRRLENVVDVT